MSVAARGQDSGSPGPNLVRGGDFEGEVGEFLRGRGSRRRQFENIRCISAGITDEEARSGERPCKIVSQPGRKKTGVRYWCPRVVPGGRYLYEFYYKIVSGSLYIEAAGGLPREFTVSGPTKGWEKFSIEFVAATNEFSPHIWAPACSASEA